MYYFIFRCELPLILLFSCTISHAVTRHNLRFGSRAIPHQESKNLEHLTTPCSRDASHWLFIDVILRAVSHWRELFARTIHANNLRMKPIFD